LFIVVDDSFSINERFIDIQDQKLVLLDEK